MPPVIHPVLDCLNIRRNFVPSKFYINKNNQIMKKTMYRLMTICLIVLMAGMTACKKDGAIVPQVKGTDSTTNNSVVDPGNGLPPQ